MLPPRKIPYGTKRVLCSYDEVITSNIVRSPPWLGQPLQNVCVRNAHRYDPFITITIQSFPHPWLITEVVTRGTTSANSRVGTSYPSGAPEFTTVIRWCSCCSIFGFLRSIYLSNIVFLIRLAIVLSVLKFAAFNYPFSIIKLF